MDDRWIDPNEDRLTPEREAEIRHRSSGALSYSHATQRAEDIKAILRELDAVRAERDRLRNQVSADKEVHSIIERAAALIESDGARAERLAAMLQRHLTAHLYGQWVAE